MMRKNYGKKFWNRAVVSGFCVYMTAITTIQSIAGVTNSLGEELLLENQAYTVNGLRETLAVRTASESDADMVTASNASVQTWAVETGDLWSDWTGDLSFLNGEKGNGTKEHPYQISTKAHLMGLSELAANDMVIDEGEGTDPGDYSGSYFVLTRNIDLGGMEWLPIGFYGSEAEIYTGEPRAFCGYFDGNGKCISNFRIYDPEWSNVGLFGTIVDSEITNLTVKPGYVVASGDNVGILGGNIQNSAIRDVQVEGTLRTGGDAGGIAGEISDGTVIENCTADHVAIDSGAEKETFVGGIAGKAAESLIIDCTVNTGDSYVARIQGGGYVGGIVGFQNSTDIFNVHVMGTIGGNGAQAIGGVTGKYASGKLKVARFEGTIASSGLGSLSREGTFIGTHDTGFYFRYGTESGADVAYLYADSEDKILAGVCGSGIPDDNQFGYGAHIGFWHGKDNYFTLVQGQNTKTETERYFYEELEDGVLHVIDTEEYARESWCAPDHFAPNETGRPERGYLLSVLQVDTVTAVENYYDVAVLTAKGESVYSKELDKEHRGAVAAGDVVTVVTAPKNTDYEKYQMEGVPTYTDEAGKRVEMAYQAGGAYTFVMPGHDTEISAVYKKVAAEVQIVPDEFEFRVIQTRKGNRKHPSLVTEVKDRTGKLLARYLNHDLDAGITVQEVTFEAIVEKNNDVADSRIQWSVDDGDLLVLKKNDDEDYEGYTEKCASIELNLQADFFQNIIKEAERKQIEHQYQYAIPDTVFGAGVQGGIAVLTAKTRPSSSFEGKPAVANCKIPVTFQIKDDTYVANEAVSLDKSALEFVITRKLTGSRKAPTETITVTAPQTLMASFVPEYFDKKNVSWSVSDSEVISVDGVNRSASVSAISETKWIQDIIVADQAKHKNDVRVLQTGEGSRSAVVTVQSEDMLGNRNTAVCQVIVRFETEDKTYLYGGGSSSGGGASGGGSASSGGGSSAAGGGKPEASFAGGNNDQAGVSGSVHGTWIKTDAGHWMFGTETKTYRNEWAYVYNPYAENGQDAAAWFWFDNQGYMVTGWHQNLDGEMYYLWPFSDGMQGQMMTGWNWIQGEDALWRCYYFHPVSDGTMGRLYRNEKTPDGYQVDETGAWIVGGVVQTRGAM